MKKISSLVFKMLINAQKSAYLSARIDPHLRQVLCNQIQVGWKRPPRSSIQPLTDHHPANRTRALSTTFSLFSKTRGAVHHRIME